VSVDEAPLAPTGTGLAPQGDGWFVLNAREASWVTAPGRSALCDFEGDVPFPQVGLNLSVLAPREAMSMYHWEADQEDFLVLSGEAVLVIEGEQRALAAWDLVHCPAGASHVIVGAGAGPCTVLAVGARVRSTGEGWGAYPADPTAREYDASVAHETTEPDEAYAGLRRRRPVAYDPAWLPESPAADPTEGGA
jgi:uncharacterized cupin superfamily protein